MIGATYNYIKQNLISVMSGAAIPLWNFQGVLPPNDIRNPTSCARSPYSVSLAEFVIRFATSVERKRILEGFIQFRSDLHKMGLENGFQWVDGSFIENTEITENRPPADVDTVTFFHLPNGQTQESLLKKSPNIFNPADTKKAFHVDAYFVQLNSVDPESFVKQSAYWYSVWSHRRDGAWKGYLQIDLSPKEDNTAMANLDKMIYMEGQR